MANYIERDTLTRNGKEVSPQYFGYNIIGLYGKYNQLDDHTKMVVEWIEENINGNWTTWSFGIPRDGQSYAFLNEEDAMAFRLRWS